MEEHDDNKLESALSEENYEYDEFDHMNGFTNGSHFNSEDVSRMQNTPRQNPGMFNNFIGGFSSGSRRNSSLGTNNSLEKEDDVKSESGANSNNGSEKTSGKEGSEPSFDEKKSPLDLKNENNKSDTNKNFNLTDKIKEFKKRLIIGGIISCICLFCLLVLFISVYLHLESNVMYWGVRDDDVLNYESFISENGGQLDPNESLNEYLSANFDTYCSLGNWWTDLVDKISGDDLDMCKLLRFINNEISLREKDGVTLDRGLIMSTIFQGFTLQPGYEDYVVKPPEGTLFDGNVFDILMSILKDDKKVLTKDDVADIIDHTVLDTRYYMNKSIYNGIDVERIPTVYYEWTMVTKESTPINPNDPVITYKYGYCKERAIGDVGFSSEYYKIFMRYGKEKAEEYRNALAYRLMYDTSDEECRGDINLNQNYPNVYYPDGSVREARQFFLTKGKPKTQEELDKYFKFADAGSAEVDNLPFSYKDGFAYKKFPLYKKSIEDSNIKINWDDVDTPKSIESNLNLIIDRKTYYNQILGLTDLTIPIDSSTLNTNGFITTGAYCGKYLTAPLDQINVQLKDCDGNIFYTTSFKDYIIGVTYGEIGGATGNPEYAKSQMLAAISYALNRRNNYTKGNTIVMRSGNCDQVYCSGNYGCHHKASSISCGSGKCTSYVNGYISSGNWKNKISDNTYAKLSALYDEASQFLVVKESNGKVFGAHYVNTYQNRWKDLANQGYPFTSIILNEYQDEGATVIKCSEQVEIEKDEGTVINKEVAGSTPSEEYPLLSPDVPYSSGFAYSQGDGNQIEIDPDWISANTETTTIKCKNTSIFMTVNKNVKYKFEEAANNICTLVDKGVVINGKTCKIDPINLSYGGAFARRKTASGSYSLHSYGLAIDWNINKEIKINNSSYKPYTTMENSREVYEEFVKSIGGNEKVCENVNWVLAEYAYKPAGFTWGGDADSSIFDPTHYELKK